MLHREGGIACRARAKIRRAGSLAIALLTLACAGCAVVAEYPPSALLSNPMAPYVTTSTAASAENSSQACPACSAPKTLPEAIQAYWHCLQYGPPPKEEANADKKEGNGKSAKEDDKSKGEENKKKDDGGKDKEKEKGHGGEAGDGKDNDKDKDKDKEEEPAWLSTHLQTTAITEAHSNFSPPYSGPNSLRPSEPMATSMTGTLFLDAKLWEGGELVFNPEIAGGQGLSNVMGIAGFPNGEITRVGVVEPTFYLARLYLQQTFGMGGEQEKVDDGPNQIAGMQDVERFTIKVGKLPATDVVDDNRYSHDPRTQFMNWALMYNGAWDYPSNVRGYTFGVALEYNTKWWTLSYGIFAEPEVANGAALDPHIADANGQVLEWEQRYEFCDHPGAIRFMGYLNHAHMGNYREALAEMPVDPVIADTRAYRFKYGFGISWDQELTRDLGVFGRLGWDNGQSETWAFTEIDDTASLGLALKGTCWCRPNDVVGLAGLINGLSDAHRDYLAAGGLGFIIGDGKLNYGPEEILEVYYLLQIRKWVSFTVDFQEVNNMAYNRDRGAVAVGSMRLHFEY